MAGILGVVGGLFLLGMAFALLRQARRAVAQLDVTLQAAKQVWLVYRSL